MKSYNLTFLSKNKKSLNNSFLVLQKNSVLHFNIFKKYFNKRKKIKKLTILKSPHVNKTAQEQFEIQTFSRQLNIYSPKNLKYLMFLKKIKTHLFSDTLLKINFVINKKNENDLKLRILKPNNFTLNTNFQKNQKYVKKQNILQFKKIKNFIKIFDILWRTKTKKFV